MRKEAKIGWLGCWGKGATEHVQCERRKEVIRVWEGARVGQGMGRSESARELLFENVMALNNIKCYGSFYTLIPEDPITLQNNVNAQMLRLKTYRFYVTQTSRTCFSSVPKWPTYLSLSSDKSLVLRSVWGCMPAILASGDSDRGIPSPRPYRDAKWDPIRKCGACWAGKSAVQSTLILGTEMDDTEVTNNSQMHVFTKYLHSCRVCA